MYYEQVEIKLNALFEGIERASQDPSSKPLGELKEYFAYLISQPIFFNFVESQKNLVLCEEIDPCDLTAFAFLWVAFYSACTKRDSIGAILETDPVGCQELERYGLFPLTWIDGTLIAMFQTYKPYEWGQDLRKDGFFSRLERLHHSALADVHTVTANLEKLQDGDRYVMKHLAVRDKDNSVLLNEIFPAHFRSEVKLTPIEYKFLNIMLGEPRSFTRKELAPRISKADDLEQAKDKISDLKKRLNAYCKNIGLSELIVGKNPYRIAVLSVK